MTAKNGGTEALAGRHIVLVGLMGAGKSTVGRALARRLGLPFIDADDEIEKAADRTISEIFSDFGEAEFRRLERDVIARILSGGQAVLAAGGGAVMDPETRDRVARSAVSVWLRAPLDVMAARTARRSHRPLLKDRNHLDTLKRLLAEREPVYSRSDVTVEAGTGSPERTVDAILDAFASLETA